MNEVIEFANYLNGMGYTPAGLGYWEDNDGNVRLIEDIYEEFQSTEEELSHEDTE